MEELFLSPEEWGHRAKRRVSARNVGLLSKTGVLPGYREPGASLTGETGRFLANDLIACGDLIYSDSEHLLEASEGSLFEPGSLRGLTLSDGSTIRFSERTKTWPSLCPIVRELIQVAQAHPDCAQRSDTTEYPLPGAVLTSRSEALISAAHAALGLRVDQQIKNDDHDLAKTANYMGSKRALAGFLVGAIERHLPSQGEVLDLMCGSGAASAVFNRFWSTSASDAQQFCRLLARVQGGGYSRERASEAIEAISPHFYAHVAKLEDRVGSFVERDTHLSVKDESASVADFRSLLEDFPTFPGDNVADGWDPQREVLLRQEKGGGRIVPYCLFTAYFANSYFGVRQAVEIDSLRYAIDQLSDSRDRAWALGALAISLSDVGTTYAAHFAQPPTGPGREPSAKALQRAIEQRSRSVFHEFSARLSALAEESADACREIRIVPGPWEAAIDGFAARHDPAKPALVYVDAPYKREEYGRYYHVLETLVAYSYPTSVGRGRVPARGNTPHHRFPSEFFTRSRAPVETVLARIVANVVSRGWSCAWSYSDAGMARMDVVCSTVARETDCRIESYATPYVHRAQGRKRSQKDVTEYLLVFESTGHHQ